MKTQDQAFNRLLKKLTALRATLKSDERNLLDVIVTRPFDEVAAHSMNVTPISPAKTAAKTASADEVKAHALNVRTAKTPAKTASADEMKAHALNVRTAKTPAKTASADEMKAHALNVRIVFDQTKDEYQKTP